MRESLRALFEHAIDYAGTFPPARLSLSEALENFSRYRAGPEAWVLGRFVCPVAKLEALEQLIAGSPAARCPLAAIGTGGPDLPSFERSLDEDARRMGAFQERWAEVAPLEAYEVRLPAGDPSKAVRALGAFRDIELFAEVAWEECEAQLEAIADADGMGAKARTGGVEPKSFPASEPLAAFLREALDAGIPCKLTAGLHEPLRHYDPVLGVRHHGFLNVFVAAALHVENDLSTAEIAAILESEDARAFHIEEHEVSWGDWRASSRAIEAARDLLRGFGSCSVDEPLQGLARLGLIAEVSA